MQGPSHRHGGQRVESAGAVHSQGLLSRRQLLQTAAVAAATLGTGSNGGTVKGQEKRASDGPADVEVLNPCGRSPSA
jgi:hypothetical protein